MSIEDWLHAIAVWSPNSHWSPLEQRIPLFAYGLRDFPPEAFCEETVKLVARRCEVFPAYAVVCEVLEGYRP
jgi:hypothetical protein